VPKGVIVYTVDKAGTRTDYNSKHDPVCDVPIIVLVNGNSASASEVLSGCLRDYGLAKLVGETTYGKGIVQRLFPFNDGSAVKLTISSYYTPGGFNLQDVGLTPDVEIAFDSEQYAADGSDNQLEKALELLKRGA